MQLIDAGQLYRKLRKNLGAKNCEFAPEHIREIVSVYESLATVEREGESGIASRVFDNEDFGYYKVTIERPKRLKAQFSAERIAALRFDRSLREPMAWAYGEFGDDLYDRLAKYETPLLEWCEKQELNLNAKQKKALTNPATWHKQRELLQLATGLMRDIGTDEYNDFNLFAALVEKTLKAAKCKLSSSEKNAILNAVSWYDAAAEKVVKGVTKLTRDELQQLLDHLGCVENQLADFGFYATGKPGEWLSYESESDLRDTENVPLDDDIRAYFCREVKPHVSEAWINLDATKIGYEISFNKYFYRHQPLRSLEEVTADILKLEAESDGLIKEILSLE